MGRLLRNRKAQNTMEYALLIAIVIGVFSAMQLYLRRGMQGRLKNASDTISELVAAQAEGDTNKNANMTITGVFGDDEQYEPYYTAGATYNMTTTSSEGTETGVVTGSGGKRELTDSTVKRSGTQQILGASDNGVVDPGSSAQGESSP